jgi:hypothetical protein
MAVCCVQIQPTKQQHVSVHLYLASHIAQVAPLRTAATVAATAAAINIHKLKRSEMGFLRTHRKYSRKRACVSVVENLHTHIQTEQIRHVQEKTNVQKLKSCCCGAASWGCHCV